MAGIKKLDDDKKTEKKSNVEKLLTQILKRMESVDKNTSKAANTKSIKNLTAKSIVEEEAIEKAKQNARLAKLKADDLEEKIKARAESDKRKAEKDALDIEKKKADMHNKAYSRALKEYNSQLELQQKINELEKSKSDAYKTNSLYRMGSNIASQQSGVVSSIALSTITGGIIDPVLIKNLGLDKPFKALWNMFGRGIGNLFSSGKISKEQGIYKKELEKLNKRMDLLTKKDQFDDGQSVVAKEKDSIGLIARTLNDLKDSLVKPKKEESIKKEKENSFFDKLLTGAKILAGIIGITWLMKNWKDIKNTSEKTWKILTKAGDIAATLGKGVYTFGQAIGMTIGDIYTDSLKLIDSIKNFFTGKTLENAWTNYKYNNIQKQAEKDITEKNIPFDQMTNIQRKIYLDKMTLDQREKYLNQLQTNETGINNQLSNTIKPIINQLPEKWTYDDRVKYGLITDTSNFRSDIPSAKINGIDAIAMSSLGLSGTISKQNTKPYIARENAGRLIALDQYFANKGIDIEYTSAMGGNHVGGKKSHAMGNKIDFVRKDRKPFSKEDLRWLETNGYIHGNTGAVGWHDAGSGYHVDASIGGYNNVTTIPGKAVTNKTTWTSTRINTPEDNMVEAISSNNILLNNIANNTSTNDGYLETNTNTTQSQQPVQIFNISQNGIGPNDSVYDFGDVAKSIILSTI